MLDVTSYMLGKKAGGGAGVKYIVVEELPQTGDEGTIYLVPKTTTKTKNIYDEYMYISDNWELIGDTQADLSNYVDMSSAQTISGKKTFTTLPESSTAPSSNNQLSNKKYVDDAIQNIELPSDLIRYKGHVLSENALPKGSQSSETPLANRVGLNKDFEDISLTKKPQSTIASWYQSFQNFNWQTYGSKFVLFVTNSSQNTKALGFITDYPEQLQFCLFELAGGAKIGVVKAVYDPNKPIYSVWYNSYWQTWRLDADEYINSSMNTPYSSSSDYNYMNSFDGSIGGGGFRFFLNTELKYVPMSIPTSNDTIDRTNYSLISSDGFVYSGNNICMKGDEDNSPVIVTITESEIEEGETYTVGENYDIYVANSSLAWEVWSKQLDLTSITGYDASQTQSLKNVNGTIEWVDET